MVTMQALHEFHLKLVSVKIMIIIKDKHREKGSAQSHLLMEQKPWHHPSVLHPRAGSKDELQLFSSGICERPQRQDVEEDLWEAGG